MKNKGLIIAIICLCVTILISTIIVSVVIINNTGSTNELARRQIEQDEEQKREETAPTNDELFHMRYGMTAEETKEFIREQLKLTLDNSDIMTWDAGDYIDNELLKLKDVEGLTIWRNIQPSDGKNINMYVSHERLIEDPIEVMIYANEYEDGTVKFIVCHEVEGLGAPHIIFEMDEEGWYADRMAAVIGGSIYREYND